MQTPTTIGAAMILVAGPLCAGGGTWNELGDAGDLFGSSQVTSGIGPLTSITGGRSVLVNDWVDAYRIKITDPSAFFAATSGLYGGSADFDTRMFLFTLFGQPLLMNDDHPSESPFSSLLSGPGFYTTTGEVLVDNPQELFAGQEYVLAIATFGNMVEDASNVDCFSVDSVFDFDALYGPNPAADVPDHWENGPTHVVGSYTIALGGATYAIPAPGSICLLGAFGLLIHRPRRREPSFSVISLCRPSNGE